MAERHSVKEALFSEEVNPSIGAIRKVCLWFIWNTPDLTVLEGWRKWIMRAFYISLILGAGSLLIQEGFTLINLVVKGLALTILVGIINCHFLASVTYSFLFFWENLGSERFK